MSQICQYRHSPNQSLVAHTGSATGSDDISQSRYTSCVHSASSELVCHAVQSVAILHKQLELLKQCFYRAS
eukprot:6186157-Pleurochrysis_carterae.AAC.1